MKLQATENEETQETTTTKGEHGGVVETTCHILYINECL